MSKKSPLSKGYAALDPTYKPPEQKAEMVEVDVDELDQELFKKAQERREYDGRISSSSSSAHPLIYSCMMLRIALMAFIVITLAMPMFVQMYDDRILLPLFVIQLILAIVVAILYHGARIEEQMLALRAKGIVRGRSLDSALPISAGLFTAAVLIQLMVALGSAAHCECYCDNSSSSDSEKEESGGGISKVWVWFAALLSIGSVVVSLLLVKKLVDNSILNDD